MANVMMLNTSRFHTVVGTEMGMDDDAVKAPRDQIVEALKALWMIQAKNEAVARSMSDGLFRKNK